MSLNPGQADDLIRRAAKHLREQTDAYVRLEAICAQITAALVSGEPETINTLVRVGESETLRMRSRLVQIMSALAEFADARSASPDTTHISVESREKFEQESGALLSAVRSFARARTCATLLAANGSAFASACLETFGVPPTTYRAPYTNRGEGRAWA